LIQSHIFRSTAEVGSGLVEGAMHLDAMCLRVFSTYKIMGRSSAYPSDTFAVIKTSTGYQLSHQIANPPTAQYPCGTTDQPAPPIPSAYIARRQPAQPLSYLVERTLLAAQARVHQQCVALSRDGKGHLLNCRVRSEEPASFPPNCTLGKDYWCTDRDDTSQYWWNVIRLTDGSAAIVIEASGPYGQSTSNMNATAGLTNTEIAALQTAAELGALLPATRP
jgi:hypothetical protein